MDHLTQLPLVQSIEDPLLEAYTTLGALSAKTSTLRLGALCTCNFFRNPSLLAKMGATVDVISDGRFWLGIGAGWFEEEALQYGFAFPETKERLDRLEEALQIVDLAWTKDRPSFKGRFYEIDKLICNPLPLQKPRPPILVGGSGEKVTLSLVAKYADACNLFSGPREYQQKLRVLKMHCERYSRDYDSILKTKLTNMIIGETRDRVEELVRATRPKGQTLEEYRNWVTSGTPSEIIKHVEDLYKSGMEYFIFNLIGPQKISDLELFGTHVMTAF